MKTTDYIARLLYNAVAKGEGLSLRLDGSEPTKGYVVGMASYEMRLRGNAYDLVRAWVKRTREQIGYITSVDLVLGAWIDGDHIYFDVSEIILDRTNAIDFGHANGQLAIYDIAAGETIRLDCE